MQVTLNNLILKEIFIAVNKVNKRTEGFKKAITTERITSNRQEAPVKDKIKASAMKDHTN